MLAKLLTAISPAGARGRLSTLIFHRVLAVPDPLFPEEVAAWRFDQICGWIRQWFNVLPLDEAVRRLAEQTLPARAMAITFDDGYEDNCSVALPILQRHGLSATFFIATGFLDGGRMWNDTVIEAVRRTTRNELDLDRLAGGRLGRHDLTTVALRRAAIDRLLPQIKYLDVAERLCVVEQIGQAAGVALPTTLMMRSSQVQALQRGGMQVGAHTVSHPILAKLDERQARREMVDSKACLEQLLDRPVTLFAYPNGKPGSDYSAASVALARAAGFAAGLSTVSGSATAKSDVFQLPRFTPWDRTRLRFGARLLLNLTRSPRCGADRQHRR